MKGLLGAYYRRQQPQTTQVMQVYFSLYVAFAFMVKAAATTKAVAFVALAPATYMGAGLECPETTSQATGPCCPS